MVEAVHSASLSHIILARIVGNCVGAAEDKLVYLLRLMRVIDAVKETIADVSSASPSTGRMVWGPYERCYMI